MTEILFAVIPMVNPNWWSIWSRHNENWFEPICMSWLTQWKDRWFGGKTKQHIIFYNLKHECAKPFVKCSNEWVRILRIWILIWEMLATIIAEKNYAIIKKEPVCVWVWYSYKSNWPWPCLILEADIERNWGKTLPLTESYIARQGERYCKNGT